MNVSKMSIKEIEALLNDSDPETSLVNALKQDRRKGVQVLVHRVEKKKRQQQQRIQQWEKLKETENGYIGQGYVRVAGVDEVGRGPLAGPVVAAAVILGPDLYLPGLDDSKNVSPMMRTAYYQEIVEKADTVGIGVGTVERIDRINIYQASLYAMKEAVEALNVIPDLTLNDAVTIPELSAKQVPIIGGDGKCASIAAASIVAKVTRDRMMTDYSRQYPEYGFDKNMGYGTREHVDAIKRHGVCDLHRKSFGVVKEYAI